MISQYDEFDKGIKTGLNGPLAIVRKLYTKIFWDENNSNVFEQSLDILPSNSFTNTKIDLDKMTTTKIEILQGNTATATEVLRMINYIVF